MKTSGIVSFIFFVCLQLSVYAQAPVKEESLEDILNTEIDAAAKYAQTADEAPASITVITHRDISNYGYQTLDEVLATVPGFYTSLDRNYGYIGTRGFSRPTDYNNRILILINGQRINENFYGFASVWTDLAIDLKTLERIEIVRGPGSALYGTGAMFGVINLVTKTGASMNGTEVNLRGGSFQNYGADIRGGKLFSDGSDWMFSAQWEDIQGQRNLYFKEYDSPETNFGVAENLDWDRWYGLFTTYQKNDFFFQFNAVDRRKGIPTASFEADFNSPFSRTMDQRQSFLIGWDKQINSKHRIELDGYWNRYYYEGIYPYGEELLLDKNDGRWLGSELRWQWDIASHNRFIAGAEYVYNPKTYYSTTSDGVLASEENHPFSTYSVYVQDEHQIIENLAVTLGIRYDNALKTNAVSPRFALVYHVLPKSTFKFLYGQAFRSPNAYETYFADGGFKPNPNIRPENIRMVEAIWQQRINETIQAEVSIYRYNIKDLIDTVNDPIDSLNFFTNVNSVTTKGFEISGIFRASHNFQGYGSYSYADSKDSESKLSLTNSPDHIARLGMVVPLHREFQASAELRYESGRKTVHETETGSALLTNITLRGSIPGGALKHVPITFQIRNLFDVNYSTPGGFEHKMPDIQQNGRTFLVEAGFRFDFK